MIVRELLLWVMNRLVRSGVNEAGVEAEVIIRHVLGLDRADFFGALVDHVDSEDMIQIDRLMQQRVDGTPLAYIVRAREFYGLDFHVDSNVLIPRPETELLVEMALNFLGNKGMQRPVVADVGTGSGAIAVAIASELPSATVFATDISRGALRVANVNCRRHGVEDRVHLIQGDLLDPLKTRVDVIVSNLPYLRTEDIPKLTREMQREPFSSLDGGPDGFGLTKHLMYQSRHCVKPEGMVLLEIAPENLHAGLGLGHYLFPEAQVSYHKDLLGLPRAVSVVLAPVGSGVVGVLNR